MSRGIISQIDAYIDGVYHEDAKKFAFIRRSTEHHDNIQISPAEGKIISLLLKLHQAKNVVEIGSFVGYSTAWIGEGLPSDGKLISFEMNQTNWEKAKHNISQLSFADKIKLVHAKAEDKLHEHVNKNEVDAFFIDAKKADYRLYLALCKIFLRKGGLLIADNTIISREISTYADVINKMPEGIKAFNKDLVACSDFTSTIIKTRSGLTIAIKN